MIGQEVATKVLTRALQTGADLAEIYIEDLRSLRLGLDDRKLEQAVRGRDRGAGVRVFFGNLVTYAYTDSLDEASLLAAAAAAASAGNHTAKNQAIDLTQRTSPLDFPVQKPFDSLSIQQKADLLQQIDAAGREHNPLVAQVSASYYEHQQRVWLYNSDGLAIEDERNIVEVRAGIVAVIGDVRQSATASFGGQMGLELLDEVNTLDKVRAAAQSAIDMLDARPCPAGEMPVVITNGWGGVLFHEACGHQMEADFINKGSSAYSGKLGQQVAAPVITAVDDGTVAARRGSMRFDDDGTPTQRTVLIEKGIMTNYMSDLQEARRMGQASSTGNGRRQSYRHMPMPRMTNTFIDQGEHDPEEIIASTPNGLYIKSMAGGQADIAKGDFVFNATEAYLIENGKLTEPVRGATVFGNGPKVMRDVDMVGNDLALDPGHGTCGKGQWVRVSVGQPTLRLPNVSVGGTE